MLLQNGYFLFSLDTELAWGYYDTFPASKYQLDACHERVVIKRLLNIFDKYGIAATWALVGHMFYAECEKCSECVIQSWKGKYTAYNQIYAGNDALWYGSDIVDMLRETLPTHEIAFHGYTHRVFDTNVLSEKEVQFEIDEWLRLAEKKKISPVTAIFPHNLIGFLPIFKKKGFICYRGRDLPPRSYAHPYLGKVLRFAGRQIQIFSPVVYDIEILSDGLVNLPGSGRLFGWNRRVSSAMDGMKINWVKMNRLIQGVKKAASEKKIIHIRTHPFEFQTEQDFDALELLLSQVANEIKRGVMQSVTMRNLAQLVLKPITGIQ